MLPFGLHLYARDSMLSLANDVTRSDCSKTVAVLCSYPIRLDQNEANQAAGKWLFCYQTSSEVVQDHSADEYYLWRHAPTSELLLALIVHIPLRKDNDTTFRF